MICEVACVDDGAARFIQKRLRLGTIDEKNLGLSAIFAGLDILWRNQHGSFLLQGIFEFGSNQMRKDLIDAIYDLDVVEFCMHVHGYAFTLYPHDHLLFLEKSYLMIHQLIALQHLIIAAVSSKRQYAVSTEMMLAG
jgi:hypothetical protein